MYLSMSAAPCPKRFETIFTSSGWETSLGILFLVLALVPIPVENIRHALGCQIIVKVVVHLNCRRPAAGADALHFFEGEDTIRRNAFVTNAQLFLELFEN